MHHFVQSRIKYDSAYGNTLEPLFLEACVFIHGQCLPVVGANLFICRGIVGSWKFIASFCKPPYAIASIIHKIYRHSYHTHQFHANSNLFVEAAHFACFSVGSPPVILSLIRHGGRILRVFFACARLLQGC